MKTLIRMFGLGRSQTAVEAFFENNPERRGSMTPENDSRTGTTLIESFLTGTSGQVQRLVPETDSRNGISMVEAYYGADTKRQDDLNQHPVCAEEFERFNNYLLSRYGVGVKDFRMTLPRDNKGRLTTDGVKIIDDIVNDPALNGLLTPPDDAASRAKIAAQARNLPLEALEDALDVATRRTRAGLKPPSA